MKMRCLVLVLLAISAVVIAALLPARGAGAFPVCIALNSTGFGAPHLDFTLEAVPQGASYHLAGEAVFSQAISPPNGFIVYSVSGTAILNDDSFWISLLGAGFNLANEVFHGIFALRLKSDISQNSLTYARQALDGSAPVVLTGAPRLQACP